MDNFTSLKSSLQAIQQIINLDVVPAFDDLSNNSLIFNDLISAQTNIQLELNNINTVLNQIEVISSTGVDGYTPIKGIDYFDGINGVDGINAPLGLLAEYVVTGSPASSIDFQGLDIIAHKGYRIEADLKNATASGLGISLFANNDLVQANYASVAIYSNGSTISSSSLVYAYIGQCDASVGCSITANLSLSATGFYRWSSINCRGTLSVPISYILTGLKKATISNITQLTLVSSVANSLAVGSRIRIFRGDA